MTNDHPYRLHLPGRQRLCLCSGLPSAQEGKGRDPVQAERKRQADALLETLKELCAALEIRPDSVEQRSCISLMESAACVHIASLEKVQGQRRRCQ